MCYMLACDVNARSKFSWQGVKMGSMRFRFDGQPINESDTPAQVCIYIIHSSDLSVLVKKVAVKGVEVLL